MLISATGVTGGGGCFAAFFKMVNLCITSVRQCTPCVDQLKSRKICQYAN